MPDNYIVQPGDNLSTIAQRFGLNYMDIAKNNGIVDPNMIQAGASLNLRGTSGSGAPNNASPLTQMIDKMGQFLKPQEAFSSVLPYETAAAPLNAVAGGLVDNYLTPQFNQTVLDPFNEAYGNNAASNNMNLMGNGQRNYNNQLFQTMQPYHEMLNKVQESFSGLNDDNYLTQANNYATSPLANFNFSGQ